MNTVPKSSTVKGFVTLAKAGIFTSGVPGRMPILFTTSRISLALSCSNARFRKCGHVVKQFTGDDKHEKIHLVNRFIGKFVVIWITCVYARGVKQANTFLLIVASYFVSTDIGINRNISFFVKALMIVDLPALY